VGDPLLVGGLGPGPPLNPTLLCHLQACLEGDAGQILWDAGIASSADELVALLRNRFGSDNQAERYRAELRALRRRRGDSPQVVYQEVRRLMALAFPGQSGTLWEVLARNAFLDALGDQTLTFGRKTRRC